MRILYLDLDSQRPDHLGCYGYHRNTSPNIDRIAAEGIRFDKYYCSDAPCLPSRTAMFSGRFGIHTGVVGHGGTAGDMRLEGGSRGFRDQLKFHSLPALLRAAGLKTVTISPFGDRHSAWHFYAGFSEIHDTGKGGLESAEEITPTVMKWIDGNAAEDDWFLHVNYWDPHGPYRAPKEFWNLFENDPLPEWITAEVLDEHRRHVGPHSAWEVSGMYNDKGHPNFPRYPGQIGDRDDLRLMFDGYDVGIRYMDEHIGRIFNALADKGVLDDLVIIISADHAENMGELGIYGEHATADHATCNIPMIIRWPGGPTGHVDGGLHYNLDMGPTLAELLGRQAMPQWDGQSFAPVITAGEDCGRDSLVVSQCAHVAQRGVRFGQWLYVRTYHDGYHLFPDEMLFNIEEDPHEQRNLADDRRDLCKEAVYILNQWHDDMMKSMLYGYDCDPLWTVIREGGPLHARGHLKKYCDRLQATGRSHAIEELKRRHPGEFAP